MAGNFAALWPVDSKFLALKDPNLLKKYTKNQEGSYNFRLGFALSNRPYFNSFSLLRVPFSSDIAVFGCVHNPLGLTLSCHLTLLKIDWKKTFSSPRSWLI